MDLIKKIVGAVAILTLISFVAGGIYFIEGRYALSEALTAFEGRVDKKWDRDDRRELRQLIRELEDLYGKGCANCPPESKRNYDAYQDEIEEISERLQKGREN